MDASTLHGSRYIFATPTIGEGKNIDSYVELDDYLKNPIQHLNWDQRPQISLLTCI